MHPNQPDLTHSHSSSPASPANLDTVRRSTMVELIAHLLKTRPMAFWSGVWVSVFLISVVAIGSLLSPSAAERRSVSAIAVGSDSAVATQPIASRGQNPLWIFGAAVFTCTAGSILVSRKLKPAAKSLGPKSPKRVRRVAPQQVSGKPRISARPPVPVFGSVPAQRPMLAGPSQHSAHPKSGPSANRPKSTRVKPGSTRASTQKTRRSSPKRLKPFNQADAVLMQRVLPVKPVGQPAVTVIPPEQGHALDWGEGRLADAVDLRRRWHPDFF